MSNNNHNNNHNNTLNSQYAATVKDKIFVFGSNLAGRHGVGAAATALNVYGARYGKGQGHVGQSYAIPTKDQYLKTLPLHDIAMYVQQFITYAKNRQDLTFYITPIGCGYAGYKREQIRPFFLECDRGGNAMLQLVHKRDGIDSMSAIDEELAARCFFAMSWLMK